MSSQHVPSRCASDTSPRDFRTTWTITHVIGRNTKVSFAVTGRVLTPSDSSIYGKIRQDLVNGKICHGQVFGKIWLDLVRDISKRQHRRCVRRPCLRGNRLQKSSKSSQKIIKIIKIIPNIIKIITIIPRGVIFSPRLYGIHSMHSIRSIHHQK